MSFKKLIRKIFTEDVGFTDYVPIGLEVNPVKTVLEIGDKVRIDVSGRQFSLAYNPIVIGIEVKLEEDRILQDERIVLASAIDGRTDPLTVLHLTFLRKTGLELAGSAVYLFQVRGADLFQLNWLKRLVILTVRFISNRKAKRYFGSLTFSLHKKYAAIFSIPRKVVLLTVQNDDFYKTFPIDLHGRLTDNTFLFGLRHSNEAVPHLKSAGRLVMASVSIADHKKVYALGKFKSHDFDASGLENIKTDLWQISVPNFVLDYVEMSVFHYEDIGSQCLFFAKPANEKVLRKDSYLHHVHLIEYLENYKNTKGR